jgi:hypothetical protein
VACVAQAETVNSGAGVMAKSQFAAKLCYLKSAGDVPAFNIYARWRLVHVRRGERVRARRRAFAVVTALVGMREAPQGFNYRVDRVVLEAEHPPEDH